MTPESEVTRFPSFDSLRAAHSQLIKQYSMDVLADSENFVQPVEAFLTRAQATGALLDSDSERESAQTMLDYWTTRLYRMGKGNPDLLLDDFNENLAPEIPDSLCPYRGLSAFGEDDASIFFGREKMIHEVIELLKKSRFAAVVGPSGSGKSSVVRAGLLPKLKQGAISIENSGEVQSSADWVYLPIMVPGSNPLNNLAKLVHNPEGDHFVEVEHETETEAEEQLSPDQQAEITKYVNDPNHLSEEIALHYKKPVVLVVDQFEEVFTLSQNEFYRRAFIENILNLTKQPDHRVILTMRIDFMDNVKALPELNAIFEANLIRMTPLTAADLREAIEEPAKRIGLKFQEGLIDQLLNDILGEPAALPLLQFTLLKLWENRDRNRITFDDYNKLGGGRQALAKSADDFYNNLIPEEQVTARRILLRLVKPGEGTEVTSQRMRRIDLYVKAEAVDRIDRVLNKFLQARLLRLTKGRTPYDDQIEVAHEALVRNWPTLVTWLDEERDHIRKRQRLTNAANRWNELNCSEDLLLRGVELEEALRYDDLSKLEGEFLEASQQARVDEIEKAKEIAEELRRRNRIITAASIIAAAVAVIAVFMGGFALNRWTYAEEARVTAVVAQGAAQTAQIVAEEQAAVAQTQQVIAEENQLIAIAAGQLAEREKATAQAALTEIIAQEATKEALSTQSAAQQATAEAERERANAQNILARSQSLANEARTIADRQTDLSMLLALEAAQLGDTLSSNGILLDVLRANPPLEEYLQGHTGAASSVSIRPDGRMLASGSTDRTVQLWQLDSLGGSSSLLSVLEPQSVEGINAVAFSSDNKFLAAGSCEALNRSGTCSSGLLQFWDLTKNDFPITKMVVHRAAVKALAFDSSGTVIATGGDDGVIFVWRVPPSDSGVFNQQPSFSFTGHTGAINALVYSPNNRFLVSASEDKTVQLREPGKNVAPIGVFDHKSPVNAVAFSPDGRYLATGGDDNNIFIYSVPSLIKIAGPINRHTYPVTDLVFTNAGRTLVSSSEDGTLIVWDMSELVNTGGLRSSPPSQVLTGHTDAVLSLDASKDGKILASSARSSAVIRWNINPSIPLTVGFVSSEEGVSNLAFNASNASLLVQRSNRRINEWDLTTGLQSGGQQWVQVEAELVYPLNIAQVFLGADGEKLGLSNRVSQAEGVKGIDVSQFNGEVDWVEVETAGYAFAYIKATEGDSEVDERFAANWENIQQTGMLRGAYHFFRFDFDPLDQAKFFVEVVNLAEGDLPPVVVFEALSQAPDPALLENLRIFLTSVEEFTGRRPIIYTSPIAWQNLTGSGDLKAQSAVSQSGVINASDYLLWVANYTDAAQPTLPSGWGTWAFWQYNGEGEVSGVPEVVSLNRFNGNLDALRSLARGEPPLAADPGVESSTIIDLTTRQQVGSTLPLLNPTSAALNPQKTLLATGAATGSITFWDIIAGRQQEGVLYISGAAVSSLAFDSQGEYLAAGSDNGSVNIWNLNDRSASPTTLQGHVSSVISLAFSPNGEILVTGSADGSIILWDLETSDQIGQALIGASSSVTALAINAENSLLASGYADGTVLFWNIDPESWNDLACQRAGRNLTEAEWNKYMSGIEYAPTCP
jgi:WD40 repeat protein/energy-coupling factor transporter ATP-binding protein EcfA2